MVKILRLKFKNHPVLADHSVSFIDPNEEKASKYISLIIGQNGSGKTQILKAIVDILIATQESVSNEDYKWNEKYDFEADIYKDGAVLFFYSDDKKIMVPLDHRQKNKKQFLPNKLLASSYTFNDKFPKIDSNPFYFYAGLKTTSNNIFLNRPTQDTFENLAKIILNPNMRGSLDELFKELEFDHQIRVTYKRRRNNKVFRDKRFLSFIADIRQSKRKTFTKQEIELCRRLLEDLILDKKSRSVKRFQDDAIRRTISDDNSLKILLRYLRENQVDQDELLSNTAPSKRTDYLSLGFTYAWKGENIDEKENSRFINHFEPYNILSQLDIVSFDKFYVFRKQYYSFEDASSGEFHLIHIFSSILANITPDSIILVDEPEISLHFDWQNRFFKLLEPITHTFRDCQFIIATHSHFLVSNLHKKSSSIISMQRRTEDKILIIKNLSQINTEGWSAEQILFDVFNVASDRNYYLSMLVEELVTELSRPIPRTEVIEEKKQRLSEFNLTHLNDKDPFKKIVKSLVSI